MKSNPSRIALLALCSLCATAALAAPPPADGKWRGTGGAALSATSGNSSTQAFMLGADMARLTAQDKITLGGAANYARGKVDGVNKTTANKWAGFGQYDYNLSAQLFAFGKLGLEGDALVDLSLRSTVAGGLGYKIVDTKELAFSVFGGAAYSTDKYDTAQTIGDKTDTRFSRASLYLGEESSHQLSDTVSFKQRLELYPGLSGDKAKIMKFTAGLGVAMSGTMSLTVGLTDSYNSKPPAGSKKNDVAVFTGINVKFGAN
jgi:putative salt-induced outer membrane protein